MKKNLVFIMFVVSLVFGAVGVYGQTDSLNARLQFNIGKRYLDEGDYDGGACCLTPLGRSETDYINFAICSLN